MVFADGGKKESTFCSWSLSRAKLNFGKELNFSKEWKVFEDWTKNFSENEALILSTITVKLMVFVEKKSVCMCGLFTGLQCMCVAAAKHALGSRLSASYSKEEPDLVFIFFLLLSEGAMKKRRNNIVIKNGKRLCNIASKCTFYRDIKIQGICTSKLLINWCQFQPNVVFLLSPCLTTLNKEDWQKI